jgi:hypothetical protein
VKGLPSWRRTSQISLRLGSVVSISPIYISGEFGGNWSSGKGGPKLEGLAASKARRNSVSWSGFAEY